MKRAKRDAKGAAKGSARGRVPIPLATLRTECSYDFDLFLRTDEGDSLYRARHTPFSAADRDRLLANGVGYVYVEADQRQAYRTYLLGQLGELLADPDVPLPDRCEAAHECTEAVATGLFAEPEKPELYEEADRMVRSMVSLVLTEPDAVKGLVRMLRHDYYTYTHLINVSTLSVALGLQVGISDREELCRIGLGGLLHDIGKTKISGQILNCREPLSDQQMAELRRHPDYGIMIVMERPVVSREIVLMVHQHHERLDGTGYPVGLVGKEIATVSRICSVVDIYDAMTCKRPYREALDVGFTLDHLKAQSGERLDSEIVKAWVDAVPALTVEQIDYQEGQPVAAEAAVGAGQSGGGDPSR